MRKRGTMNYDKAYRTGFETRCRELGVAPDEIVKQAQYAGGLGGAAIGGLYGLLRGSRDNKRRTLRDRLYSALKGTVIGGGIGALGEIGLKRHVNSRADGIEDLRLKTIARNADLPDNKAHVAGARAKHVNKQRYAHANNPLTQLSGLLDRGSKQVADAPSALADKLLNPRNTAAVNASPVPEEAVPAPEGFSKAKAKAEAAALLQEVLPSYIPPRK